MHKYQLIKRRFFPGTIEPLPKVRPLPRILCWVMCEIDDERLPHVKQTWIPHCDISLFLGSSSNASFPIIGLNATPGRSHIDVKYKAAWNYIYQNHISDADYFVKADPDTFLVVENLKSYLSNRDPGRCEFFGHTFELPSSRDHLRYNSGGPGQVR